MSMSFAKKESIEILHNSHIERCFGMCLAQIVFSKLMRRTLIVISIILFLLAIIGSSKIEVYFS